MQSPTQAELEALIAPIVQQAPFDGDRGIWRELIQAYGRTGRARTRQGRSLLPAHRGAAPAGRVAPVAVRALPRSRGRARRLPRPVGARALQEHDHHVRRGDPGDHPRPRDHHRHLQPHQADREEVSGADQGRAREQRGPEATCTPKSSGRPRARSAAVVRGEGPHGPRQSNPKEATVEAHGLVDGQPTGAHFRLRIYDDVVTLESVTTPEQVKKDHRRARAVGQPRRARSETGRSARGTSAPATSTATPTRS
jgi:hypothetical protein